MTGEEGTAMGVGVRRSRGLVALTLLAALAAGVRGDVNPGPGWHRVQHTVRFENLERFPDHEFWLFPTWLDRQGRRLEGGRATLSEKATSQLVAVPRALVATGTPGDEFFRAPDRIRSVETFRGDGYVETDAGYTVREEVYRVEAVEAGEVRLAWVRDDRSVPPPPDPWRGAGLGPIEVAFLMVGAAVAIGLLLRRRSA